MLKPKRVALLSLVIFAISGCASFVSNYEWPVVVRSNPESAQCKITNGDGNPVYEGNTPMSLALRSKGGYFKAAKYSVTCQKPGYHTTTVNITSSLNSWYWGNVAFGGITGLLFVDPLTGAMWKLDETVIVSMKLEPEAAEHCQTMPAVDEMQ